MGMRSWVAACGALLLLAGAAGNSWAKCPNWTDPLGVVGVRKENRRAEFIMLPMVTTSSLAAYTSSVGFSSSNVSGTSGCPKEARLERETHQYIAANGTALLHEMAQGHGDRLNALAHLLGCDQAARDAFGAVTQAHFEELAPPEPLAPPALVFRLKLTLQRDAHTAGRCSEV